MAIHTRFISNYNSNLGTVWPILTAGIQSGLYGRSVVQMKMLIDFKFKAILNLYLNRFNNVHVKTCWLFYD